MRNSSELFPIHRIFRITTIVGAWNVKSFENWQRYNFSEIEIERERERENVIR